MTTLFDALSARQQSEKRERDEARHRAQRIYWQVVANEAAGNSSAGTDLATLDATLAALGLTVDAFKADVETVTKLARSFAENDLAKAQAELATAQAELAVDVDLATRLREEADELQNTATSRATSAQWHLERAQAFRRTAAPSVLALVERGATASDHAVFGIITPPPPPPAPIEVECIDGCMAEGRNRKPGERFTWHGGRDKLPRGYLVEVGAEAPVQPLPAREITDNNQPQPFHVRHRGEPRPTSQYDPIEAVRR